MKYSESEIRQYVAEEDVKFLRMTFFDLTGNQKNMSILPDALDRAFSAGIAFDASAIPGFGDELRSDLFLQPDTSTLCLLPWRPDHGRVARLFCRILRSDGLISITRATTSCPSARTSCGLSTRFVLSWEI